MYEGRREARGGYSNSGGSIERIVGFVRSISASFLARRYALICFSLEIASTMLSNHST
jgi:hypothetical protein